MIPPTNDVQRQLAQLWEGILGVKPIGLGDNFFDLGGESLAALRLSNAIAHQFGKRLSIVAVFKHPTIEELASLFLDA